MCVYICVCVCSIKALDHVYSFEENCICRDLCVHVCVRAWERQREMRNWFLLSDYCIWKTTGSAELYSPKKDQHLWRKPIDLHMLQCNDVCVCVCESVCVFDRDRYCNICFTVCLSHICGWVTLSPSLCVCVCVCCTALAAILSPRQLFGDLVAHPFSLPQHVTHTHTRQPNMSATTGIPKPSHTHIHTRTHTYTHTRTYIHTYEHTHKHNQMQPPSVLTHCHPWSSSVPSQLESDFIPQIFHIDDSWLTLRIEQIQYMRAPVTEKFTQNEDSRPNCFSEGWRFAGQPW